MRRPRQEGAGAKLTAASYEATWYSTRIRTRYQYCPYSKYIHASGRGIAGSVLRADGFYLLVQYKHVSTSRCILHITVTHALCYKEGTVATKGLIPLSCTLNIVSSSDTDEIKAMRCALLYASSLHYLNKCFLCCVADC